MVRLLIHLYQGRRDKVQKQVTPQVSVARTWQRFISISVVSVLQRSSKGSVPYSHSGTQGDQGAIIRHVCCHRGRTRQRVASWLFQASAQTLLHWPELLTWLLPTAKVFGKVGSWWNIFWTLLLLTRPMPTVSSLACFFLKRIEN